MRSSATAVGAIVIGTVFALLTGCSSGGGDEYVSRISVTTPAGAKAPASSDGTKAVLQPDLSKTGPGSLVEATELTNVDPQVTDTGARGMRVVYRSTSGVTGQESTVGGVVFVPAGTPPEGGWPIVSYGHGHTGVLFGCGPSLYPDLLQYGLQIASLLTNGYIVAMSDYEGLGSPGAFPMFEPKTLGANVIDAMRAAHLVSPQASNRWAAFGGSIGGTAAWAANEMAASYAPEYDFVGSVALVPAADIVGMAQQAAAGTLTQAQQFQYILEVLALKQTTHPEIVLEDFISGEAARNLPLLTSCRAEDAEKASELVKRLPPSDTVPRNPDGQALMAGWLGELALPKNKLTSPMLLIYTSDDDIVKQEWTDAAVRRSCDMGSQIDSVLRVGQGHDDVDGSPALPWLRDALDGAPVTNDVCAQ